MLLCGCTSLNRYESPRTVAQGAFVGTATYEYVGGYDPELERTEDPGGSPPLPKLGLRYGVLERAELGLELGSSTAALDWKHNLLLSRWLDLALDPVVTAGWLGNSQDAFTRAELPLLVGINVASWLSIVPQATIGYARLYADDADEEDVSTGLLGGAVGVRLQPTDFLAIMPVVGTTVELDTLYRYETIGIGLSIGSQPVGVP